MTGDIHIREDLYYRVAAINSDKEYHIQVVETASGFMVNFQYGRRGNHLQELSKTLAPVPKQRAFDIFRKIVSEKKDKGYKQDFASKYAPPAAPLDVRPAVRPLVSDGPLPTGAKVDRCGDDAYCMQPLPHGIRAALHRTDGAVVGVPANILAKRVLALARDAKGGDYRVEGWADDNGSFIADDIAVVDGADVTALPYRQRLAQLRDTLDLALDDGFITVNDTYQGQAAKRGGLAALAALGSLRGVLFRCLDAPLGAPDEIDALGFTPKAAKIRR